MLELDEIYGWREIDKTTMFIGVVGMGGSEIVTTQCFNQSVSTAQAERSLPAADESRFWRAEKHP